MKLLKYIKKIKKSFLHYNPSVEVLISKKNLLHNLQEYQKRFPNHQFAPVLKSNAYGHGLSEIAQILENENVPFFIVDSLFEARVLRDEGTDKPILIIGYTSSENIQNNKLSNIIFAIISLEQLQEIIKEATKPLTIHLKIDTGMHRQGIILDQVERAIEIIKSNKHLKLEGICSHLADASNSNDTFTKAQIDKWEKIVSLFKKNFQSIKYFHIAATAGVDYVKPAFGNVVRLGIGLYGFNISSHCQLDLKPVLSMQSIISSVKKILSNEYIGYGCTYKTPKEMKVATVPVGYYEGVDRRLSNLGVFKIKDSNCPILGRVSMNITSIDVSGVPEIKINDKITVVSAKNDDRNSVINIARSINTIPYEILIHIPQHLRRVIIQDN